MSLEKGAVFFCESQPGMRAVYFVSLQLIYSTGVIYHPNKGNRDIIISREASVSLVISEK
jgi:hypothetical protein